MAPLAVIARLNQVPACAQKFQLRPSDFEEEEEEEEKGTSTVGTLAAITRILLPTNNLFRRGHYLSSRSSN